MIEIEVLLILISIMLLLPAIIIILEVLASHLVANIDYVTREKNKEHVWINIYTGELEVHNGPPHRHDILNYEDLGPL